MPHLSCHYLCQKEIFFFFFPVLHELVVLLLEYSFKRLLFSNFNLLQRRQIVFPSLKVNYALLKLLVRQRLNSHFFVTLKLLKKLLPALYSSFAPNARKKPGGKLFIESVV